MRVRMLVAMSLLLLLAPGCCMIGHLFYGNGDDDGHDQGGSCLRRNAGKEAVAAKAPALATIAGFSQRESRS